MSVSLYHDLADKHVLVTGGASGIGAAIVEAFEQQHARLSILDIMPPQTRPGWYFESTDLRDPVALESGIAAARNHHGPIQILINNAARDDRHTLAETDSTTWDDLAAINLRAAFLAVRAVAPDMASAHSGVVVNLSSNAFLLGLSGYPAYVTAKAGLWGMTKALARELGPEGIRVNCLVPGWVMTERQLDTWATPEALESCLAAQCLKQTITPEDIVEACLFLASEASRMMTAQMLVVDGGRA